MRHFLFEDKEYKIRFNWRKGRREPDGAESLVRQLRRLARRPSSSRGGAYGGVRKTDARQKCVVKVQYSNSIEAHRVQLEKYLAREGTGRDGSSASLFGTDINEYRENMVAKNFRVFLSPQSDKVDLKTLTEKFVKKLEMQTGYKLFWQGACHYNTAHPHAHLLINGVDKNGKEVALPRDVIKTFMRESARDLCTAQLGNRTAQEMAVERERELLAPRFTRMDERIKDLCGGTYRVTLPEGPERARVLTRLESLRALKLCKYENGGYKLTAKWDDNLKANGRYNAFLKARGALRYAPQSSLRVYSGESGEITGRVAKIYRTDGDASDNHAVVVEALNGRAYFVPLFKAPEAWESKGVKTPLKEGDLLTIKPLQNQKGRLTPSLIKTDEQALRRLVKTNKYTGPLAAEIAAAGTERGNEYQR